MRFRNIVGNPPFQDTAKRGKTQHKIWIDFTMQSFNTLLEDDGNFGWISPNSFSSPSNKVLNLFRDYEVKELYLDTGKYFPDVGSTFSNYTIAKNRGCGNTIVHKDGSTFNVTLDKNLFYLPNDFCDASYSIHRKVIFNTTDKLDVRKDYVTCHNILLKKSDTLSKNETDTHVHPVFHTNRQKWFSSIKQDFSDMKKVMWTRSGYTKPFYDDGTMGCTDMGYYILVEDDKQGENLRDNLNTELFRYILKTAKWCGFGNEKVFSSLPKIPIDKRLSDEGMYDFFCLSDDEIDCIKSFSTKKVVGTGNTQKIIKSNTRVKFLGEVFTPQELVDVILDSFPQEEFTTNQRFLDPACGNGNFLVEVVSRKKGLGISGSKNASTIYGVDIMEDNVLECKKRILDIIGHTNEHRNILDKNIVCENGLEYDYSFSEEGIEIFFLTNAK